MPWNPEVYNKFKAERYAPFFDLLALIKVKEGMSILDLGCGTGELTAKLPDTFPQSIVLGIDSSTEMLEGAKELKKDTVEFKLETIENIVNSGKQWDLVFSNAAIHWVPNHHQLIPAIVKLVKQGGQLAIQLPSNHTHFTHTAIKELVKAEPYHSAINGWTRTIPVLTIEDYSTLLFNNGVSSINVFEKIFPHVLKDSDAAVDWVSGTALVPYLERLPKELHEQFMKDYRKLVHAKYPEQPLFYPFKRTFIYGAVL